MESGVEDADVVGVGEVVWGVIWSTRADCPHDGGAGAADCADEGGRSGGGEVEKRWGLERRERERVRWW